MAVRRGVHTRTLAPGSILGVLGGGQLGRMLTMEARRMGYRVRVYSPAVHSPAGAVADAEVAAGYDDEDALREFARGVDVVTIEFENIPVAALELLESTVPVRPPPRALHVAQNRLREKRFLARLGLPHAPFRALRERDELFDAWAELGGPAVLKTAGFGYDGKGQTVLRETEDVAAAASSLTGEEMVIEAFVPFERELSIVVARDVEGGLEPFPVFENRHRGGVLDLTVAPAEVSPSVAARALELARAIAEELEYVGVLCVEFFLRADGELLVNEIAPRPHNSGHLTIEACATSQFEQQLRAVCGLPLGSSASVAPAAMANLLGDLWEGGEPQWSAALAVPGTRLHLYGKDEARPGRKMGHITAVGESVGVAAERVERARSALGR